MNLKWPFLIIAMILICVNSFAQKSSNSVKPQKNKFGFGVAGGISKLTFKKADWNSGNNYYNDTLYDIKSNFIPKFDLILFYQVSIRPNFELRPTFLLTFGDGGELEYQKKIVKSETIKVSNVSAVLSIPVLLKFPSTQNRFYVTAGPSFLYVFGQDDNVKEQLPINEFDFLLDLGVGMDFPIKKIYITPEIKYSAGLTNLHTNKDNLYCNTIEKLYRNSITLSFLFRDRY